MLKKIFDICLKLSCSAIGVVLIFAVNAAAGSMSMAGSYECKMPDCLIPHEDDII